MLDLLSFALNTAISSYADASRSSKEIAPVGQAGKQSPNPSQKYSRTSFAFPSGNSDFLSLYHSLPCTIANLQFFFSIYYESAITVNTKALQKSVLSSPYQKNENSRFLVIRETGISARSIKLQMDLQQSEHDFINLNQEYFHHSYARCTLCSSNFISTSLQSVGGISEKDVITLE